MAEWSDGAFIVYNNILTPPTKFGVLKNTVEFLPSISNMPLSNNVKDGIKYGEMNEKTGTLDTNQSNSEVSNIF